jgi:hypothetical protein
VSRRRVSAAVQAVLILFGGLVLGALAAVAGFAFDSGVATASTSCAVVTAGSNVTATFTLTGGDTVTLSQNDNAAATLLYSVNGGTAQPCGTFAGTGALTGIKFVPDPSGTGTTVILNQNGPGGVFPCIPISGALGAAAPPSDEGTLQVDANNGETVDVGTTGVNLAACGPADVGTLNDVGTYFLVGGTGDSTTTLDANGAGTTGSGVQATFFTGNEVEHINPGAPDSTLDFSALSCGAAATCSIIANSTGSPVTGFDVPKSTAWLLQNSKSEDQYSYTAAGDLTTFNGNSSIPTDWYADAGTYDLDSHVTFEGNAGTSTISSSGSGNQVVAGTEAETYTVNQTGSPTDLGVTLTGGSGTDSFTVTGTANNVFEAGAGSDSFFDDAGANTISFADVTTTPTNQLNVDTGLGTAKFVGTSPSLVTYTFANQSGVSPAVTSDFTTFAGPADGNTDFITGDAGGLAFEGSGSNNEADFSGDSNPNSVVVNLSGVSQTSGTNGVNLSSGVSVPPGEVLVATVAIPGTFDTLTGITSVNGSDAGGNTFFGGSGAFTFTANIQGNNIFNGSSGGTYTIEASSGLSGNVVNAGSGVETFTVQGSSGGKGVELVGGPGTATFTVSGNENVFSPGSGPDFFYDATAPNTLNFSDVGTSPSDQLGVNVSGAPQQVVLSGNTVTLQTGQAEVGSGISYTFLDTAGASGPGATTAFTTFDTPTTDNTEFLAGAEFQGASPAGGLTFNAVTGSGDSISFPTVMVGMTIDLAQLVAGLPTGTATVPGAAAADTIHGISTVVGSSNGSNVFDAGPAFTVGSSTGIYNFTGNGDGNQFYGYVPTGAFTFPATNPGIVDVFSSNGSHNEFFAGIYDATFNDSGSNNTADFSKLTTQLVTVNVSGIVVGTLATDSAEASAAPASSWVSTYTFNGFGANDGTFVGAADGALYGASAGTTFDAGSAADTFEGQGLPRDTLTFEDAAGSSLLVCVTSGPGCSSGGVAVLGTVDEAFLGITVFDGLKTGFTTFVANDAKGGYTFDAFASGNVADFSTAAEPIQANLSTGQVTFTSGVAFDTISGITTIYGSDAGGNTFTTGSTSETFGDRGSGAELTNGGDSINFSGVPTDPAAILTINASGGGSSTYTATFGSVTYTFTTNGPDFTNFIGALDGYTDFEAGGAGGYTFTGQGSGNILDFSADTNGIVANLSSSSYARYGGVAAGDVLLSTGGVCPASSATPNTSPTCDVIKNVSTVGTVIGSANGQNTFVAGLQPDVFEGGVSNTIDFTNVDEPVVVNVSQPGESPQSTAYGTASFGGIVWNFSSFDSSPITFIGSPDGTTFYAGSVADIFHGGGVLSGNTLSYGYSQGDTLLVCVVQGTGCSAPLTAFLGPTAESFSDIGVFDGLPNGDTTFVTGDPGGYSFTATGANNSIDYSTAGSGVTVNLSGGTTGTVSQGTLTTCPASNCDLISGLTTVTGAKGGGNTFTAGPAPYTYIFTGNGNGNSFTAGSGAVTFSSDGSDNTFTGGSGAATFSSTGDDNTFIVGTGSETLSDTGTGNTINFSAVPTSSATPLIVNVSGTPTGGVGDDMASASGGSVIYNFTSGGGGFTILDGAATGYTHFYAPKSTGGYTFAGGPGSADNTVDFTANTSGITVNLSPTAEGGLPAATTTLVGGVTVVTGYVVAGGSQDTISSITAVIGSPFGDNVFYGGLTGTTFSSTSSTNLLSYLGLTNPGVTVNLDTDVVSGAGASDTFNFAPGSTITIQGSTGSDVFYVGTTSVILEGGGGDDTLNLSLVSEPTGDTTGVTVNLGSATVMGSVAGTTIGGVTFTPGCGTGSAPDLCITMVVGSKYDDTFIANPDLAVMIVEPSGQGILNLSQVTTAATITMPTSSDEGTVLPAGASSPTIMFRGIATVFGTEPGGDTFIVTPGAENFNENPGTAPGTLNFSLLPIAGSEGVSVEVNEVSGVFSGTVTSAAAIGIGDSPGDTFSGIGTFIGTPDGDDTFTQTGSSPSTLPYGYTFEGGSGSDTLYLPDAPGATVTFLTPPPSPCGAGTTNDGTAVGDGVNDIFCNITLVIGAGAENFSARPGQTATLNGGGAGILNLVGDTTGQGVVVTLPNGTALGSVTGDGYDFEFTGMSTINGTPFDDLFIPGSGNVTINGGGGSDGVSFLNAAGAVVVNLSKSSYTVGGMTVPAFTAIGGNGGVITLNGISNIIGTSQYDDVLIAGSGPGTLIGGSGNDRFVLTGGTDFINGGTGSSTLDLSELPSQSEVDLGSSALQFVGSGSVSIVPGTIETVIAAPDGGQIMAGPGNITLDGSGNDWLAAGTGTDILNGDGSNDILLGGVGDDTLNGGTDPVTFVPGQGNDTLTSLTTGNTLSYSGAPDAVHVNLSDDFASVPTSPQGVTQPFPANTGLKALTATGGWGTGDSVSLVGAGISDVIGTAQPDIFATNSGGDETIDGNGGNDLFLITGNDNVLDAAPGSDSWFIFVGPGANNQIDGGGNSTVDFAQVTDGDGVVVNLQAGVATGGFGGTQYLSGIQNVIGTFNGVDTLIGDAPGGTLIALNGSQDTLEAGPDGGDTLVALGGGSVTFCADSSCAYSHTVAGGPGNVMLGGSGPSQFFAQNGFADTINGGGGGAGGFDIAYVDPQDTIINIPPADVHVD